MKEEFIHYIWKHKLFDYNFLVTTSGEKIEVINIGEYNSDAGPDFFNAKVKIGNTLWAGNVEIHINSSDWIKHNHHKNKAYDNVILQVVLVYDTIIKRTNGEIIPAVELKFDKGIYENYQRLQKNELWIPCQNDIKNLDKFIIECWLSNLLIERIEKKSEYILRNLAQNINNWEETLYQQLARSFGFNLNSVPFELLARSIPMKYLGRHKNNLKQIEALLFGQAGFLDEEFMEDDYYNELKKEYLFLQKKFKLKPIGKHLWKFLRLRPSNFPTIRIAQFARLIYESSGLFSQLIIITDTAKFRKLFQLTASDYWNTHYVFNKTVARSEKRLGDSAFQVLLINTVIPFLFVYGKSKDREEIRKRSLNLLEQLEPEKNSIIAGWSKIGIQAKNAFDSQALIHLKKDYCNQKYCLRCQIGNKILTT